MRARCETDGGRRRPAATGGRERGAYQTLPPRAAMRRRAVIGAGAGLAGLGLAAAAVRLGTSAGGADDPADPGTGGDPPPPYAPLASRRVDGAADCRVSPDGATAYVATGDGVTVLGVPDLDPVADIGPVLADREDGPLEGIWDLAVDGDHLLVHGPANHTPGALAGVARYDVADPAAPALEAFHETAFPIHNAALAGDRAYLSAVTGLAVVAFDGGETEEVGRWSPADVDARWSQVHPSLRVLHDVHVRGDLAVCSLWDAGTWLLDVADPADPTVVSRFGGRSAEDLAAVAPADVRATAVAPPGNHHSAALSADGTVLAVTVEAFDAGDGEGGPGGVLLYDVRDPTDPAHLATVEPSRASDETRAGTWTTAHDAAFDGDRLVSAWYQGGVRVHDVSDPTDPRRLAAWRRPAEVAFWSSRPAAGGTFVATATTLPDDALTDAAYLFPTRAGEQADPPSLTGTTTGGTAVAASIPPRPPIAPRTPIRSSRRRSNGVGW